jgi:predicted DNA-binding transcriptional regulator AlpA
MCNVIHYEINNFMKATLPQYYELPDGRLNTKSASTYLGLSMKTLAMMRTKGSGPKFIKRGRIFYYRSDLDEWLNSRGKSVSTAQQRIAGK